MKTFLISIKILLKYVPLGPIGNKSALALVVAWYLKGTKPLPEPVMTQIKNTIEDIFKFVLAPIPEIIYNKLMVSWNDIIIGSRTRCCNGHSNITQARGAFQKHLWALKSKSS